MNNQSITPNSICITSIIASIIWIIAEPTIFKLTPHFFRESPKDALLMFILGASTLVGIYAVVSMALSWILKLSIKANIGYGKLISATVLSVASIFLLYIVGDKWWALYRMH